MHVCRGPTLVSIRVIATAIVFLGRVALGCLLGIMVSFIITITIVYHHLLVVLSYFAQLLVLL